MLVDWNIQRRSQVCQICSNGFQDKQIYHTALFEEPDQYERWDVCGECWKDRRAEITADANSMISHWKGVFEAPTLPPPEPIQKENAESLLRKLIELEDPTYLNAQFILAVMLERKRILKIKAETRKDGVRWLMYERAKTGELFPVQDPDLRLDALDKVQEQIAELFETGLPSTSSPGSAETEDQQPSDKTETDPSPKQAATKNETESTESTQPKQQDQSAEINTEDPSHQ